MIRRCFECGVVSEIEYGSFCVECKKKFTIRPALEGRRVELEDFINLQKESEKILNQLRQETGRLR